MDFLWGSLPAKLISTFFISMVPILELRGAIPIATMHGLNLWLAIVMAVIGNLVPVPFIIIFSRKLFAWIRIKLPRLNNIIERLERRADKHSKAVNQYKFWGLFILVAIPLPGTGAWTGAFVASMLEMRIKKALPAITCGVFAAAIIVAVLTYGAGALLEF